MGSRITHLVVEGVKRIKAVDVPLKPGMNEITGQNEQGKTSVLDSIWWAFAGKRNIQDDPINRQRDRALTRIELDDGMVVTRTYRRVPEDKRDEAADPYTTSVSVEIDGAKVDRPQEEVLNRMIGSIAFDPLEFIRLPPAEQFRLLRRWVPEVDFEGVKLANERDYAKRRDLNRDAKALDARIEAITLPEQMPVEVDEAQYITELEEAAKINEAFNTHVERVRIVELQRHAAHEHYLRASSSKAAAERMLKDAERELEEARFEAEEADEAAKKLGDKPPTRDTSDVRKSLEAARAANSATADLRRKATEKRDMSAEFATKVRESDVLTNTIDSRNAAVAKAVAEADLPVTGLSFDAEGNIFLNGLPFAQASGAIQLRTSIAIAAAMNPGLSVILVRDGSRLDDAAMDALRWFADTNDVQILIETVSRGKPNAILIEDGSVGGQP